MFVNGQHLKTHFAVAESNGDDVSDFDVFRWFDDFAVDLYTTAVASLLSNGATFDDSGYFQKFVYSHKLYYISSVRLNQEEII